MSVLSVTKLYMFTAMIFHHFHCFNKGNNFYGFLFTSLDNETLLEMLMLFKEGVVGWCNGAG